MRAEENLAAINSNDTETVAIGVQTLVHIRHAMIMDTSEPKISSVNSHEVNLLANYLLACLLAYLLESANSHAQGTQLKGDDTQGKNGVDCLERVIHVVIMALLVLLRMAIYCLSASWHSTLVACEASLTLLHPLTSVSLPLSRVKGWVHASTSVSIAPRRLERRVIPQCSLIHHLHTSRTALTWHATVANVWDAPTVANEVRSTRRVPPLLTPLPHGARQRSFLLSLSPGRSSMPLLGPIAL